MIGAKLACMLPTGWILLGVVGCGLGACGGDGDGASKMASTTAPALLAPDAGTAEEKPPPEYPEEMFVETEGNRDPFRTFTQIFKTQLLDSPQREVVMGSVGIDQMRVTAVISGVPSPRALIVDPNGVGYVVKRGDFVGRPEVLQVDSDSPPLMLNWRVSRVRGADSAADSPGQVVLTRENPMAPNQPPLTRTMILGGDADQPK
ncbi:MAG: hypothetical protein H6715_02445 [Myxococcales bacterium]|nr:hypothetical protein [Myxococcales bacterium]MCB9708736.1 hypothetical protein [Myxococcales bacterium]